MKWPSVISQSIFFLQAMCIKYFPQCEETNISFQPTLPKSATFIYTKLSQWLSWSKFAKKCHGYLHKTSINDWRILGYAVWGGAVDWSRLCHHDGWILFYSLSSDKGRQWTTWIVHYWLQKTDEVHPSWRQNPSRVHQPHLHLVKKKWSTLVQLNH